MLPERGSDHLVNLCGGGAAVPLCMYLQRQWQSLVHALAGQRGNEEHGHIIQKLKRLAHHGAVHIHRVAVFWNDVPLVDYHDGATRFIEHHTGYVRVLGGERLARIDQQQHHLRPVNRLERPQHAVFLHARDDFPSAADAGCVYQGDVGSVIGQAGVNGVARCACQRRDNHALLPEQFVQQAALSHVWTPDDGDGDCVILRGCGRGRQLRHNGVEQIAAAEPVQRGDGVRFVQAELEKLLCIGAPGGIVTLVYYQQQRRALAARQFFVGAAQHVGHLCVCAGHAGAHVGHEDNYVRLADGQL